MGLTLAEAMIIWRQQMSIQSQNVILSRPAVNFPKILQKNLLLNITIFSNPVGRYSFFLFSFYSLYFCDQIFNRKTSTSLFNEANILSYGDSSNKCTSIITFHIIMYALTGTWFINVKPVDFAASALTHGSLTPSK